MKLTDTDLQEFIVAYEADFGERVSEAVAEEMATRLLALFELLVTDPAPNTPPQDA